MISNGPGGNLPAKRHMNAEGHDHDSGRRKSSECVAPQSGAPVDAAAEPSAQAGAAAEKQHDHERTKPGTEGRRNGQRVAKLRRLQAGQYDARPQSPALSKCKSEECNDCEG